LSSFNTANVTDMSYMFNYCNYLESVYAGNGWSTENVSTSDRMFGGCGNLVGMLGTSYSSSNIDHTYAHIDGGLENPGYFSTVGSIATMPYIVVSEDSTTLSFYYDKNMKNRGGTRIKSSNNYNINNIPWYQIRQNITTVVFDASFADCFSITGTAYWFDGCKNLTTIKGLEYLKTDNVTSMGDMFRNCSCLASLDLSNFNTSNVTSMYDMFYNCSSLTSLDLSNFNTANVTSMTGMFYNCSSLTSLDLSNFNTANVTNMGTMFYGCSTLTSLDLSSFNTENVRDMSFMFGGCRNLETIYAGNGWTTDNVTSENDYVFSGCVKLVGGNGTKYSYTNANHTYARIDNAPDAPGYFTFKESTGINKTIVDKGENTRIYNISGLKLTNPRKGINIIGGKKVVVK